MKETLEQLLLLNLEKAESAGDRLHDFEEALQTDTCMWNSNAFGFRVKEVPLKTWRDDFSVVGTFAYLFDNEFVAIGHRQYDKDDTTFVWRSTEAALSVKNLIISINNALNPPEVMTLSGNEDFVAKCLDCEEYSQDPRKSLRKKGL